MADGKVILLDFWASPFAMRVRIALAMKGIEHECIGQDLFNKSPLLLEMNPVHKKVPVLIHNGKPVCESLVALQYIDRVWHEKCPLLPSDPYLRSRALFWGDYIDQKVYGLGRKMWMTKGLENAAAKKEHAAAKKEFIKVFKVLEGELGEKPFFGGQNIGYVDVALVTFYTWLYSYEYFGEFSTEVETPKLSAFFKRCLAEEAIAKSLPEQKRVHGFVLELRRKFGPDRKRRIVEKKLPSSL